MSVITETLKIFAVMAIFIIGVLLIGVELVGTNPATGSGIEQ
jgi:hypothetical protein